MVGLNAGSSHSSPEQDAEKKSLPLLIYDGDCGFCIYSVRYWQKLTGDSVNYRPYQEVASQFPKISIDEFQHAVQYVAPDGKISRAAEASFLTLSHSSSKKFWLTLYRKVPGFAFITEMMYAFIAAHRDAFYRISVLLWGKEREPSTYNLISWLFLRALGIIFFIAFFSFGIQALGLIGNQGIIPVSELTDLAYQQLGRTSYWALPMIFWFNSSDLAIELTCWGGALLSLLLVFNIFPRFSLIALYILYLSLCSAGQMFMTFQWDSYLLETGLIAIFLISYQIVGIWLLRWLLFRFIFEGGIVKILSGDPTWRDFSALSYYFMTEPLPTPLAWYAHHLPEAVLKFCTGAALFIELVIPFLIFMPRRIRFIAGFLILLMQGLILITGNYNFFNLLTMLLCLVLFDDQAIRKIIPGTAQFLLNKIRFPAPGNLMRKVTYLFAAVTVSLSLLQYYIRFNATSITPAMLFVNSIAFSVAPLRIVNPYGPFAIITTTRNEIIIEGSSDGKNWVEYEFKYKPGDVDHPLKWNIPHQPRLDWQMWFAALGSLDSNPWLSRLFERILENSPHVMDLFASNPFPDKPPLLVRARMYQYDFTTPDERRSTGDVWKREYVGLYAPEVSLKQ